MSVSAKSSPYENDPDLTKISSSNEYTSLSTLELQKLCTKLGVTSSKLSK